MDFSCFTQIKHVLPNCAARHAPTLEGVRILHEPTIFARLGHCDRLRPARRGHLVVKLAPLVKKLKLKFKLNFFKNIYKH